MTAARSRLATLILLGLIVAAGFGLAWCLAGGRTRPAPAVGRASANPAVDVTGLLKGPPVVDAIAEPDRRAIYGLWRSLDAEVAALQRAGSLTAGPPAVGRSVGADSPGPPASGPSAGAVA